MTQKLFNQILERIDQMIKRNQLDKVSYVKANGKIGTAHLYDRNWEQKVIQWEQDHDSAITTIATGINCTSRTKECELVFPRIDLCTINGRTIDVIKSYSPAHFERYKIEITKLYNILKTQAKHDEASQFILVGAAKACDWWIKKYAC